MLPLYGSTYREIEKNGFEHINGAIYICEVMAFMRNQNLFELPVGMYEMTARDSVDIDTRGDLDEAVYFLRQLTH